MKGRVKIYHAIGIIVGSNVIFGENVILRAHVTIGEKSKKDLAGPSIGDGVELGVGCMIFGNIKIADHTFLKANSVNCA